MAENEPEKDKRKQLTPYRGWIELIQVGSVVLIPIGWVLRFDPPLQKIVWFLAAVLALLPFLLAVLHGKRAAAKKAGEDRVAATERATVEAEKPETALRNAATEEPRRGVETRPYHSRKDSKVYHLFFDCPLGNNIEPENRLEGTGSNKDLCDLCEEMLKEKAA